MPAYSQPSVAILIAPDTSKGIARHHRLQIFMGECSTAQTRQTVELLAARKGNARLLEIFISTVVTKVKHRYYNIRQ